MSIFVLNIVLLPFGFFFRVIIEESSLWKEDVTTKRHAAAILPTIELYPLIFSDQLTGEYPDNY
jgi:hypothetical protein